MADIYGRHNMSAPNTPSCLCPMFIYPTSMVDTCPTYSVRHRCRPNIAPRVFTSGPEIDFSSLLGTVDLVDCLVDFFLKMLSISLTDLYSHSKLLVVLREHSLSLLLLALYVNIFAGRRIDCNRGLDVGLHPLRVRRPRRVRRSPRPQVKGSPALRG